MKKIAIVLAALMIMAIVTGCGAQTNNENDEGKLQVVTTIFPEYDWVREILGDKAENAEITMLLDDGVDLHSYQPTADDIKKISNCDMFIYVGGESDVWVEDVLKNADNKDMKVINLLEVLGDKVEAEEAAPGMQPEEGHNHGVTTFADSDVRDRTLSDWSGSWQSVYPYLQDGSLDGVMQNKAEVNKDKTAEEYKAYYEKGYQTDVEKININGEENTIEFTRNGQTARATYAYKGYKIFDYESGNRGARFLFEAVSGDAAAPKYIEFSDHCIAPAQAEHFHLYFGSDSFDALSSEMDNWPTYYPVDMSAQEIADEMIEHDQKEYDEHVWLSLKNAVTLCDSITNTLAELDPASAETYQANCQAYADKLKALDAEYQDAASKAKVKTLLFGDRFPFRYMVDDYGLSYYAAFAGCSAESEASFETIKFLAEKTDELGLKNILTIEKSDQKIAKTIIENTKNKDQQILTMDSMQSTTADDVKNGASYLTAMQNNLKVLKQALGE
ncbi:MAG: ZinT/AdcA family metal-binding protein [Eubacterium sp.]|nr:ZinT/AdcA family metal-binding protein [Eubacterium sp.]